MSVVRHLGGLAVVVPMLLSTASCIYDEHRSRTNTLTRQCIPNWEAYLALDYRSFDQSFETPSPDDPTAGGWRAVAREELCTAPVADLIGAWRLANADGAAKGHESILYWHEGQLRADIGQVNAAARLFGQAKKPVNDAYDEAWNAYADATIAFMLKDRARMEAALARMRAIPEPEDWAERVAAQEALAAKMAGKKGVSAPLRWPQNIEAVEALTACFDKPYKDAYGDPACRRPAAVDREAG